MKPSTHIGRILKVLQETPEAGGTVAGLVRRNKAEEMKFKRQAGVRLHDQLAVARRYHLSTDFTAIAATYGFNVDDPIGNMLNMARPPFDNTWIEWPVPAQLKALGIEPVLFGPEFAGVLVKKVPGHATRFMISMVGYDPDLHVNSVDMLPFSVLYDTEKPLSDEEIAVSHDFIYHCIKDDVRISEPASKLFVECGKDFSIRAVLEATLIGGKISFGALPKPEPMPDIRSVLPYATYCLTPGSERYVEIVSSKNPDFDEIRPIIKKVVSQQFREFAGIFRFVVGVLALLNTKEYVRKETIKPGKKRPGEELAPKPQPQYEFVTTHAPHVVILRHIQGKNADDDKRQSPKLHDVEGTWVTYHKTGKDDCHHVFEKLDVEGNRKICVLCGRKKSYRSPHERGNAERGVMPHKARIVLDH